MDILKKKKKKGYILYYGYFCVNPVFLVHIRCCGGTLFTHDHTHRRTYTVHSFQSRPEQLGHVSVSAVDPQHQGEWESNEGPGDALCAGTERAGLALGTVQVFGLVQVISGRKLEHFVQQDDRQGNLQHHKPLG